MNSARPVHFDPHSWSNKMCRSNLTSNVETQAILPSVDTAHIASLLTESSRVLLAKSPAARSAAGPTFAAFAAQPSPVVSRLHIAPNGVLVSSGFAAGGDGEIVLRGNIGPFPYELHLKCTVQETTITVTLELFKPFQAGPFEWKFGLGGILHDAAGNIIGATSVVPAPSMKAFAPATHGLNWWCVLQCGGVTILGILIKCLPSLIGGVPSYIACVTSEAGSGAAGIAACIASKCV
jgi:hypothetical protein